MEEKVEDVGIIHRIRESVERGHTVDYTHLTLGTIEEALRDLFFRRVPNPGRRVRGMRNGQWYENWTDNNEQDDDQIVF